jgi:hypothetical protein
MSLADAEGRVPVAMSAYGCIVRTTAELLLLLLPGWDFAARGRPAHRLGRVGDPAAPGERGGPRAEQTFGA